MRTCTSRKKIVPLLPSSRQLTLDFLLGGGKKTDRKNSRELIDGRGRKKEEGECGEKVAYERGHRAKLVSTTALSSTFFSSQCLFFGLDYLLLPPRRNWAWGFTRRGEEQARPPRGTGTWIYRASNGRSWVPRYRACLPIHHYGPLAVGRVT